MRPGQLQQKRNYFSINTIQPNGSDVNLDK